VRDVIVGTAGHIDHGKTALVRALTGIDTDRLIEEKRRGITIDIGFAHLDLEGFRVGFIDVPGHEKFVKNMLAGIGGVRLLMLVVAADESVMPQTVEHFDICRLLGIPRGIVVLTKRSLVDAELLQLVEEEVRELVRGSFLDGAPVVAVDSLTGEGLDELRAVLRAELEHLERDELRHRSGDRFFTLPIDRVFSVKGFGTVVTGTAMTGSLAQEEAVDILPSSLSSKVRGIEIFGWPEPRAEAGQRTALNLSGVARSELYRGMTLCSQGAALATSRIDVLIRTLPSAPAPLRHRGPIRLHVGTSELIGRIYLLADRVLEPGAEGFARIRLDRPTVCFPGDRFILRRYSPLVTVGGGLVLSNHPPRHRRRERPALVEDYRALAPEVEREGPERARALLRFLIARAGIEGIDLRRLTALTGLKAEAVLAGLEGLDSAVRIEQDPPLVLDAGSIDALGRGMAALLKEFHEARPLAPGMSREELKERFLKTGGAAHFQFLLDRLAARGLIEVRGAVVALQGARVRLSSDQAVLREEILGVLRDRPFQFPGVEELAKLLGRPGDEVRNIYFYLVEQGEIVRVSGEVVVLPEQLADLLERLRRAYPSGRPFTVPQFKDVLGLSRKYAIPLLEYLDRRRVTRRQGDVRTLVEGG
jgi:selenocysteine-specific elongation factor